MRKRAKKHFTPKVCACGCGETFTPTRDWQVYKSEQCRKRAWVARVNEDVESAIKALGVRVAAIEKHLGIS